MPRRPPSVVAHRGASADEIDNSMAAFTKAIDQRADMIELDVRRTADDQLVAFHDAAVGGRPLSQLTHAELAAATGHRPPLLDEVLDVAEGRIGVDVELKEDGFVERAIEAVRRRHDAGEAVVTSFLPAVVEQTRTLWPEVPCGLLLEIAGVTSTSEALAATRACRATFVALEDALVERDGLAWAAREGYPVYVWTVDEEARLRRLLGCPDVAGVITNVPHVALELREALGVRP